MNHRTFLYVEDDPKSRDVMEFILEVDLGHKVFIFQDSSNFMERVEALPIVPDLVFLDIHVAPHDGFTMLQMLREHEVYRNVHTVALTASVMSEEIELLKRSGFDSCLSKPIRMATFSNDIERLLGGEKIWRIS
jgi:chemosensory pili system protein ChpA (sensor histidine kinase/response regulator)